MSLDAAWRAESGRFTFQQPGHSAITGVYLATHVIDVLADRAIASPVSLADEELVVLSVIVLPPHTLAEVRARVQDLLATAEFAGWQADAD